MDDVKNASETTGVAEADGDLLPVDVFPEFVYLCDLAFGVP